MKFVIGSIQPPLAGSPKSVVGHATASSFFEKLLLRMGDLDPIYHMLPWAHSSP